MALNLSLGERKNPQEEDGKDEKDGEEKGLAR